MVNFEDTAVSIKPCQQFIRFQISWSVIVIASSTEYKNEDIKILNRLGLAAPQRIQRSTGLAI